MKMLRLLIFSVSMVICALGIRTFAQTAASNTIPIVTIQATQPLASSPANPGVFTVFRQGATNEALDVLYMIGGTASNGVDYAQISDNVTIPAGATSNSIVITPLATPSSSVTKTVTLQLVPSTALDDPILIGYRIGVPSNATVYVTGPNVTNLPPTVGIFSPANGSTFYTPTNIELEAQASDPDGTVTNVEFFAGSTDLGPGAPIVLDPPGVNGVTGVVYVYDWENPAPTNYSITAVATDNNGASTVSSPVNISVLQGPPPTNQLFSVRIVSPPNGADFFAPVEIPVFAYVTHPTNSYVGSVEFFDGSTSIGIGQPVSVPVPVATTGSAGASPTPPFSDTNHLFLLVWTNPPVGSNVLTAVATIGFPLNTVLLRLTSPPVDITVLASPPPPTNSPPIVNIVATDPVAVAGTNSWIWMGESNTPPTWAAWSSAVCQCFTNCGPKPATFTVHRFGDTNDDLNVTYNIGGTASNGVDYIALPGYVTVPAGERSASINIVPTDIVSPAAVKTVILTLTPSTNVPPDYIVGIPRRAAAIIVNPPGPVPVASTLADGCFRLSTPGPDGAWFSIEASTDLVNWTSICTNQVVNGFVNFIDPDAPGSAAKYYQVVPMTVTPGD
ncbi:MAG TPA: Ig-like domain-containing protein [Candidatus Sulfotelmatobacter sp.]|nr:Ig-like domain-containing protein [Candidatus Sulfotelmatobacter sp.]